MISNRLRVYYGPDDSAAGATVATNKRPANAVTVPAGEIFSAMADAIYNNRAWLSDFADDEVTISRDLYEVIVAYEEIRRPSA